MKKIKVLELFAGSRSIGIQAENIGMKVFSSDIEQFGGIDYVTDILQFDCKKVPFVPDVIWASPPCTGFSVASIGTHWGGRLQKVPAKDEYSKARYGAREKNINHHRTLQNIEPEVDFLYRKSTRSFEKDWNTR